MSEKKVTTDFPIQSFISERWSPYAFSDKPVAPADLRSLLEAARWAPSSSNEQPWIFFVATKENPAEHARLLSCLVEANQVWAKAAPVLVLCAVRLKFAKDGRDNRTAGHDLGLAAGNICAEATLRGLSVHQMAGIDPGKAREVLELPKDTEAWTAMAIGYAGDAATLPEGLRPRDAARRGRKPQQEFVFSGKWGAAY